MSKNNPNSEYPNSFPPGNRNPTSAIPMFPNLAHCVYFVNNKSLCLLSQRDNVILPRVARPADSLAAGCAFARLAQNRLPTATIGFSETSNLQGCLQGAAGLQSAGFPEHRQNVGGSLFDDSPQGVVADVSRLNYRREGVLSPKQQESAVRVKFW
jgi:hypothetical protein